MSIEIKVPVLPESVTDAVVAKWYKKVGDAVKREEHLVDLETDKVMLEVTAPADGVLQSIQMDEGAVVKAETVIGMVTAGVVQAAVASTSQPSSSTSKTESTPDLSPAMRRLVEEKGVSAADITGTGKGGRVVREDIEKHAKPATVAAVDVAPMVGQRAEKRVKLSRLRQRIAERLVQVQHEAAILTSFNEVDMKAVMDLREAHKEAFEKTHGVKLGFMSFFTKAVVEALKRFPAVNASIDGDELIYHDYCDVGIAVGSERGLVVPVLRNAELSSFAEIEKRIREYSQLAQQGKIAIEDLTGGTFTITNGGTFGSLLSTPIINPPQTAILGMHKITERPVVEKGAIVIRPMMYVALSYDHRVIDGREAVLFLKTVKDLIEDPSRLLLSV